MTDFNSYHTVADTLKETDGEGKIVSNIIEMLAPSSALIEDAYIQECNNKTSHISVIRTSIPEPQFRKFYQGAAATDPKSKQVVDTCGQLTDYSIVDASLCDIQKNPAQYRLNQAKGHLQGFTKKIMDSVLYGEKKTNPAGIDGLASRYNKIETKENSIGAQVIDGGATGDAACTSVFAITWGDEHAKLIYPEGTQAGIKHLNRGEVDAKDAQGKEYRAYKDYFEWWFGLSLGNYKSSARLANIDVTELRKGTIDVENLLLDLYYAVDDDREKGSGNTFIYANKEFYKALHKKILNKQNVNLSFSEVGGKKIMQFIDMPIRSCKEVRLDEAVVA